MANGKIFYTRWFPTFVSRHDTLRLHLNKTISKIFNLLLIDASNGSILNKVLAPKCCNILMQRLDIKDTGLWSNCGLELSQNLNSANCSSDTKKNCLSSLHALQTILPDTFYIAFKLGECTVRFITRSKLNLGQSKVTEALIIGAFSC